MGQRQLIIILFLLLGFYSFGQDFRKTLQGRVRGGERDVSGVHVLNTATKKIAITDDEGFFSISVKLNDTLLFSAVQFKRKLLPVTAAVLESNLVFVWLEEFTNALDEVVVRPYDLSGDVTIDVKDMVVGPVITETTLKLPNADVTPPTQNERKLYTARTWQFKGSSVKLDPIINYFSGRTRMLKKQVARDSDYKELEAVYKIIPDSLFVSGLSIPKDNIMDFLFFCEIDKSFHSMASNGDTYGVWKLLRKKSAVYRENNNLE